MPPLERYARFLTGHAWTVLIAVGVVTAALAAGMGRLRVSIDFESSLPANHPFVQIDHQIRREFGGRNTMIVAIVPRDGEVWRSEVLRVVQEVTLAALRLPDVIAPNLVSLAAPSVRHAAEEGGTIRVDYFMRDVPETPEEIAALRARLDGEPALRGLLVTPDQRAALVMLDFYDGTSGQDVFARTTGLAEPYRDRPLDFYFAGEPMFVLTDLEQSREVAWRIPFTFLVIAGMLLVSFRSVQGMLVPMLTATLSTLWGLGLMGWTGIVIDGWNVDDDARPAHEPETPERAEGRGQHGDEHALHAAERDEQHARDHEEGERDAPGDLARLLQVGEDEHGLAREVEVERAVAVRLGQARRAGEDVLAGGAVVEVQHDERGALVGRDQQAAERRLPVEPGAQGGDLL